MATGFNWPSQEIQRNSSEAANRRWQLKGLEVFEGKEILISFKNFERSSVY